MVTKEIQPTDKVVIFGAGLVGTLLGIMLADRGFQVEIHEKRPDLRVHSFVNLRSINLALSHRGWKALEYAGLAESLKNEAIPMYGRVVHPVLGDSSFLPYGKADQAIYSISRHRLNCFLLDEAEKKQNLKIYFESKAERFAFDKSLAYVADNEGLRHRIEGNVFFGADGAFSALRYEMMREDKFFYQQHYIEHGYKEFVVSPTETGDWAMRADGLHIWPRKSFMMIALPNADKTFTCTLFFPFAGQASFDSIQTMAEIRQLFESEFPDLIPMMPDYLYQYKNHPVASLVTIRCAPWNNHNFCLIGDAAHAIVPFFGQGMNAGFEDCRILMEMMDDNRTWDGLLQHFYTQRNGDAQAISELALENFVEMRDLVTDPGFLLRKKLEKEIIASNAMRWAPLYPMVTFSDIPYAEALERGKKQAAILDALVQWKDWNKLPVADWASEIQLFMAGEKTPT